MFSRQGKTKNKILIRFYGLRRVFGTRGARNPREDAKMIIKTNEQDTPIILICINRNILHPRAQGRLSEEMALNKYSIIYICIEGTRLIYTVYTLTGPG